jgi:hypothetical protein
MHKPPENMQDEPEKEWNDAEVNAEVNRHRQIERDQMAEYFDREAGRSFAVPAELAGEYKHEALSPQNSIDPSVPPPHSATLEEIIEATKHAPRRPRAMLDVGFPLRGYQVAAIAASLAAEYPGMFAGPDVLRPVRVPPPLLPAIDDQAQATVDRLMRDRLERGITRQIAAEAHVVVADPPPLERRKGHRKGYRLMDRPPRYAGEPAGSKLARKAARGKL